MLTPLLMVTKMALKCLILVLQSCALARFEALEELYKNLASDLSSNKGNNAEIREKAEESLA